MAGGGRGSTAEGDGHKAATVLGNSQTQVYTKTPVRLKFRSRLLPPSSGLTFYLRMVATNSSRTMLLNLF